MIVSGHVGENSVGRDVSVAIREFSRAWNRILNSKMRESYGEINRYSEHTKCR